MVRYQRQRFFTLCHENFATISVRIELASSGLWISEAFKNSPLGFIALWDKLEVLGILVTISHFVVVLAVVS